ncbi:MAG: fatty acid cis/trans isomerase [Pseudomonadales bacterium]|nr:fatty acid cis/trans isomerase [Pseudomonadales bacterium]
MTLLRQRLAILLPVVLLFSVMPTAQASPVDYQQHIQPIFEQKCLACHGCYDAPCQLKLEAPEGLDRGASKQKVYNGARTESVTPTRLFTDAQTTAEWRDKGFFSVLDSTEGMQASLLFQMLQLGRQHDFAPNEKLPKDIKLGLARENTCPNPEEFDDYADDHPMEGMPLAVTGLTDDEFNTLSQWLQAGAPLSSPQITLTKDEQRQVNAWEALLNSDDKKHQLVGRWLYEHLFLAHLYFGEDGDGNKPGHFFQLYRSSTPPGEPIKPLGTVRPNDMPPEHFWYRLAPVPGSLVHKTHITLALNDDKLARTRSLFFASDWQVGTLPGYGYEDRANPFITFNAIPARARYQFMLDNAEYFVRTFIRGPVCRGQVATDVIRDQFWAVFQDPDHDLYITDDNYRARVSGLLGLPGQNDDLLSLGPQWLKYSGKRNDYLKARHDAYAKHFPQGPTWDSLWDGEGHNRNALLTIFRHHDNASVRKGLIGDLPLTTWVMDYPLFERSYYNLVVNFNVFGSVSHQAQTRLYFDLIRNGAEQNTLRYFPREVRQMVMDNWYQNTGKLRLYISYASVNKEQPTGIEYHTATPVNEFNDRLLKHFAQINARPDPINRCDGEHCNRKAIPGWLQAVENRLSALSSSRAAALKVIDYLPEVTMVRVENNAGQFEIYTLIRNRAHSNVAFMMGESLRYQPELDTLTLYPGVLASYPNFMFNLKADDTDAFVTAMTAVEDEGDFTRVVDRFGVRRTHPNFWTWFHDLTRYLETYEPTEAAILDMNRYENL